MSSQFMSSVPRVAPSPFPLPLWGGEGGAASRINSTNIRHRTLHHARVVPQNVGHRNHADDGAVLRDGQMPGRSVLHQAHGIDDRTIALDGHHRLSHTDLDGGSIALTFVISYFIIPDIGRDATQW